MTSQEVSLQVAEDLGITQKLFDQIVHSLGRQPNFLELQVYSALWAETISYKSSFKWINSLPRDGKSVVVGATQGSAGVVDMGNGICCVFKMGTHNHPAGIDPYEGAATCVGDVCRDVVAMGARPLVVSNSLRFGEVDLDRTQWLMEEVMRGIQEYAQVIGLTYQGGEVSFHSSFDTNPLVNVMVAGLVKREKLLWNRKMEEGQWLYLVGAPTGKEGVYGGTSDFALAKGDPVLSKALIEAVVRLNEEDALIKMENMDMAGIANACTAIGAQSGMGMVVNLDEVHLTQENMLVEEILLSRTQERMMLVVSDDRRDRVEEVLTEYEVPFSRIGRLEGPGKLKFFRLGRCVAELFASDLVMGMGAPLVELPYDLDEKPKHEISLDEVPEPDDYWKVINRMVENPNVVIKEYLQISLEDEGVNSPSDAQIVSMQGGNLNLCFALSGNSVYAQNDPHIGSQINVAKAVRRIVCSGGKPLALNDCLNFGSPMEKDVYSQFVESVQGIANACTFFNTPVAGGNVSFYNESSVLGKRQAIYPTPVIGMLGVIPFKENHMSYMFRSKGDMIFLLGKSREDIAGSEYLCSIHKKCHEGVPYFNLEEENQLNKVVSGLIGKKLVCSAHSVGRGGLFFNLLESSMPLSLGIDITSPAEIRTDAFLFGEAQGRVVVSVARENEDAFVDFMMDTGVPFSTLGHVTKGEIRIDDIPYGFVEEYKEKYQQITMS